jgi:hypothetical protein
MTDQITFESLLPVSEPDDRESQIDARFNAAVFGAVPSIYFNGFVTKLGFADIVVALERNGSPVGALNMSYTVAKSFAFSLSQAIAQLEEITGRDMLTTAEVEKMVADQQAKSGGEK